MIIDHDIRKYVISSDRSIRESANQIASWHGQIAFCIDNNGRLIGSVSNGDLVRWVAAGCPGGEQATIEEIANRTVKFIYIENLNSAEKILADIIYLPIVDAERRITSIARRRTNKEGLILEGTQISDESPTFIIAEIGNNHQGSIDLAFKLIDASKAAGANCAKFQMRDMHALYGKRSKSASSDLGTEYLFDLLDKYQLTNDELLRCFDYCRKVGLVPFCTAWEVASADMCVSYGLPALKIASADLTNHELINHIISLKIPIICSTGMSTEDEIRETVNILQSGGAGYAMLHCNSTYPAPFRDINLNYLSRLREISGGIVGYSGHERDVFVASAAVALGARIIEKHITLDKSLEGNDHKVSLLPEEFQKMVDGVRQTEQALGNDNQRTVSQGERSNRVALSKSIYSNVDISIGTVIEQHMCEIRGPGQGLQPNRLQQLIGVVSKRNIQAQNPFYQSDIDDVTVHNLDANFEFNMPWGIPVRHRDAVKLIDLFKPNLVEFHLSYRDLLIDDRQHLRRKYDCGLIVHAPELFEGDHTLDLTSPDQNYRRRSIDEMNRVIEKTISLAKYFDCDQPVGIVCNVGGFTEDRFLTMSEKQDRIRYLVDSWTKLDSNRVRIWPQTMPPYPWHFGGQRHHNLFVTAEDIVDLCKKLNTKVCLDVSHSRLACNEFRQSYEDFLQKVLPFAAHLHIADAKGSAGEGLQIGEGEMDFVHLFRHLNAMTVSPSFIPEVWQGHENDSEGARIALVSLQKSARLSLAKPLA